MIVCTDRCPEDCPHCRPVDYERLRRIDERVNGKRYRYGESYDPASPGRPPWWVGIGMDPDSRSSSDARVSRGFNYDDTATGNR